VKLSHRLRGIGCCIVLASLLAACSDSNSPAPPVQPGGPDPQPQPAHMDVILRDRLGDPLSQDSNEPYSPRATCGYCHNTDKIANGYHFQQGRTDTKGNVIVKADYFGDGRKFLRSAGMYGKW